MGCREWKYGKTGAGYGACYPDKKNQKLVHRWVAECAWGPLVKGQVVCHKCDNKLCFKLGHLFVGTQSDNIKDMYRKGRQGAGSFLSGENHRMSKLTNNDVVEIRKMLKEGYSQEMIAKKFGVCQPHISDINTGKYR